MELKKINGIEIAVDEYASAIVKKIDETEQKLRPYINGVVTEDTLEAWKKDRANINKEKKAFSDERIALEKGWKEYLEPIKNAYKKIDAVCCIALANIDAQLEEFEKKRKAEKQEQIEEIWKYAYKPEKIADWLTLADIQKSQWLNKGYKEEQIQEDINAEFEKLQMMHDTVIAMSSEFEAEGLAVLRNTKNLQLAIMEMNKLANMKRLVEEQAKQKAEAEAREKAEAERKALEERIRQEEREKAIAEVKTKAQEIETIFDTVDSPLPEAFIETPFEVEVKPEGMFTEAEKCLISKVFQNYYCNGIYAIAEEDETANSIFRKVGIL